LHLSYSINIYKINLCTVDIDSATSKISSCLWQYVVEKIFNTPISCCLGKKIQCANSFDRDCKQILPRADRLVISPDLLAPALLPRLPWCVGPSHSILHNPDICLSFSQLGPPSEDASTAVAKEGLTGSRTQILSREFCRI